MGGMLPKDEYWSARHHHLSTGDVLRGSWLPGNVIFEPIYFKSTMPSPYTCVCVPTYSQIFLPMPTWSLTLSLLNSSRTTRDQYVLASTACIFCFMVHSRSIVMLGL